MKLKQILSLLVVVVALGAAGVFAYFAVTGDGSTPASTAPVSTAEILPNGEKLDFESVNKFNKNAKLYRYPAVAPTDIGLGLNDVMNKGIPKSE